jgi:hypothetical protein
MMDTATASKALKSIREACEKGQMTPHREMYDDALAIIKGYADTVWRSNMYHDPAATLLLCRYLDAVDMLTDDAEEEAEQDARRVA